MNQLVEQSSDVLHTRAQQGSVESAPSISPLLLSLFREYVRRYFARHFSALFVTYPLPRFDRAGGPYVVFLNHASWWDPLVCLLLTSRFTSAASNFAPIDRQMLEKFRFFRKLGFFGIEKDTRAGARQFIRTSHSILAHKDCVLWITPQGEFVDQRVRPTELKSGIGHLAHSMPNIQFVPLALDYSFGSSRLPAVFAKFGSAISTQDSRFLSRAGWAERLRLALEQTQDDLASAVLAGDTTHRTAIIAGGQGTGGIYGLWQRLRGVPC
jgi:1-acyl-sn-glycerol-3-phosphate acyltransferase